MAENPTAILHTLAGDALATDGGNRLVVGADALPLPAGAATAAAQAAAQATLNALATQATAAALEALLTAIKDTDGIKKITDPVALASAAPGVLVGSVKIRGSDGLHDANVDASHRLSTTSALVIPAGFVDVSEIVQGNVGGNSSIDTDHVVTDTKTLSISQFFGGGEVQTGKQSKFELYHSTDGGVTDGTLIAFGYIGASNNFRVDLNLDIAGAGVSQVIRMRRERMDGVTLELAGGWIGIETI